MGISHYTEHNKGGRVFPILLLAFIFVPIIEISVLIQVGSFLGFWPTMALVLISAFVGASLVRSQGMQTFMSVQSRLQQGEMPTQQIVEGAMLAIAGILLLTPGFVTDTLGMVVLLPAPRAALAKYCMNKLVVKAVHSGSFSQNSPFGHDPFGHQAQHGQTFEGEYEQKKDDQDKLN